MRTTKSSTPMAAATTILRGLFLTFSFFFLNSLVCFAQDETRVSATWQVIKYDITATLPQTETDRSLTAKAKLDLKMFLRVLLLR